MSEQIHHTFTIDSNLAGQRLDLVLSGILPEYSRSMIQKWITKGQVLLNKKPTKPKTIVQDRDIIQIDAALESIDEYEKEDIELNIIFEDNDLLIINKPINQVVHPGAGNYTGTILNGLLYHYHDSAVIPRAGILHRLDKDTSGLMVIAKNLCSYYKLIDDLKDRNITRKYEAICFGQLEDIGKVCEPIGRHPTRRTLMAVNSDGKYAETKYKALEVFSDFTYAQLELVTGRTHQIRVHLSHIGHPLVGDQTYKFHGSYNRNTIIANAIKKMPRQALHARYLSFRHPTSNELMMFTTELPDDIKNVLSILRQEDNI